MSASFPTTIEQDETEVEVIVTYNYYRGCRGARDSLGGVRGAGPPLEPDEPPSVEILSVVSSNGKDLLDSLSKGDFERIEIECLEDRQELYEDYERQRHEI